MVSYNLDDTYCPCGEKWTFVPASLSFGDYYFCKKCDKIFRPTIEELTKDWFFETFKSYNKYDDLKKLASIVEARKKVTLDDLKRLGYIND